MKPASLAVLVLVCAGPAAIGFGQTPKYEVASIKPSSPNRQNRGPMHWSPGGRFTATGAKLKELIQLAYEVEDFQISGGPDWTESESYDIVAVPDREVPLNPANAATMYTMLQLLLEDRFQLKLHRELREMQVYALVAGRNAPKLQESKIADGQNWELAKSPAGKLMAINTPMSILAKFLSRELNRIVIDRTELKGYFDFTLAWTSAALTSTSVAGADRGPSIFTAVQDHLGLRLESTRGPVQVLIIDHIEKPTAN